MDEEGKLIIRTFAIALGGMILLVSAIVIPINLVEAHYQSQLSGYSFWQCFWAGDTVHNIVLKK